MNEKTDSYFIKADDTYVGVIDYMKQNPNDDHPWIGAFIIHSAYHNFSFGTQAYLAFEEKLKKKKDFPFYVLVFCLKILEPICFGNVLVLHTMPLSRCIIIKLTAWKRAVKNPWVISTDFFTVY
ncbi:GNAT family N-acetyltransferase [Priestia megaterium]